jgi:uncharacterized protein (DUF1778 family)
MTKEDKNSKEEPRDGREVYLLTNKDEEALRKTLENPPEPNQNLVEAIQSYRGLSTM